MATGDLKSDIINDGYSQLRISGITVDPGKEDNVLALDRLENLMAEMKDRDICLNWNTEDSPDLNTSSGIKRSQRFAVACILATRLVPDFGKGKEPDPILFKNASAQSSFLYSSTAKTRQMQYPRRQAVGGGNSLRSYRYRRYYREPSRVPNTCESMQMVIGNIDNFVEHFNSWLIHPELIDTYTIESDTGLTIVSDAKSTSAKDINYQVSAVGNNTTKTDSFLQIKIIVTSTTGRKETRLIDFELINLEDIPST